MHELIFPTLPSWYQLRLETTLYSMFLRRVQPLGRYLHFPSRVSSKPGFPLFRARDGHVHDHFHDHDRGVRAHGDRAFRAHDDHAHDDHDFHAHGGHACVLCVPYGRDYAHGALPSYALCGRGCVHDPRYTLYDHDYVHDRHGPLNTLRGHDDRTLHGHDHLYTFRVHDNEREGPDLPGYGSALPAPSLQLAKFQYNRVG